MSEEEDIFRILESELSSEPDGGIVPVSTTPGPDIPALRIYRQSQRRHRSALNPRAGEAPERQRCREIHQTLRGICGLKDNRKVYRQLHFSCNQIGRNVLKMKDMDAYQKELRNDYIVNKELSNLSGSLAFKCGRFLAAANAALITTKHIDINSHLDKSAEVKLEKIPLQSSTTGEELQTNSE